AWLKLDGFRQEWQAQTARRADADFVFRVPVSATLWQRCLGQAPGLEVGVRLLPAPPEAGALTPVAVTIRPVGCGAAQAAEQLQGLGPVLLDGVRNSLEAQSVPARERFPFTRPVRVCPVVRGRPGEMIAARGKDISLSGVGLYLPCPPPSPDLHLH